MRFPTIIVDLSLSPSNSVSFAYVLWGSVVRYIYIYSCCVFLINWPFYHYKVFFLVSTNNFFLESILFGICIAIPAFFWLLFALYIFFHLFTFNLCASLNLKCVSQKPCIIIQVNFLKE